MAEVRITYCVPCRYEFKAIQDADAILRAFGQELSVVCLVPGDHGVYDVRVDGEIVFSLEKDEGFPETSDLVRAIRARLTPPTDREAPEEGRARRA